VTPETTPETTTETVQDTVTVSYDLNGGNGGTVDYSPASVDRGTTIKLKDAPTRKGYTFVGWQIGKHTYQPGDSVTVLGDVTFTAVWEKNPTSSVPTTGDETNVLLWGGLLTASALGLAVLLLKKKNTKR
jgi:uncharacterized repeat protein (TIGR02543 family)/LPXTG-motif cell wall-anchored protein